MTQCNCSLCVKLGWKLLYYPPDAVTLAGAFDRYVRTDVSEPTLQVLRCSVCGIATHWAPLSAPPHAKLGINAHLFDPALIDGLEVRTVEGRSWPL